MKRLTHRRFGDIQGYGILNKSERNEETLSNVIFDGSLELTNNLAEWAIKSFVVGRKNWLFSDTNKGTDTSARCYSIIESAKANGLNVISDVSTDRISEAWHESNIK